MLAEPGEQAPWADVDAVAFFRIFAKSPTRMDVLAVSTALANRTLPSWALSCLACSSTLDCSHRMLANAICSGVIRSWPAI